MTDSNTDTRRPLSAWDKLTEDQRELAVRLSICAENGDAQGVIRFLELGGDPKMQNSDALRMAAYHGHAECVRLLIPVSEPHSMDSWALAAAAANGFSQCVRLLIPVSNPGAEDSRALRCAAKNGRLECVKLLIPVSDPLADDCQALRSAAKDGRAECVRLLLPVSRPLVEIDGILPLSLAAGHADVVATLLECEPLLLHGVNVFTARAHARARDHLSLDALLSSIIDAQALSSIASSPEAHGDPARRPRL